MACRVYKQREWGGTELFRSPLISFAYERGWRQGFALAGFPGVDKEYEMGEWQAARGLGVSAPRLLLLSGLGASLGPNVRLVTPQP